MEWYEYIIIVFAVGIVLLSFILKIINKKKGKTNCSSNCCCCARRSECSKLIENIKKAAK